MSGSPSHTSTRIVATQQQAKTRKRRTPNGPKAPPPKKAKAQMTLAIQKPSKATRSQPVVIVNDSGDEDLTDKDEDEDPDVYMERLEALSSQDTGTQRPKTHCVCSGEDKHTLDINLMFMSLYDEETKMCLSCTCNVCRDSYDKLVVFSTTSSVTTLRTHISREGGKHYETYLVLCQECKIQLHRHCLPSGGTPADSESVQSSLDSFLVKGRPFSKEGLLSHIIELIVTDDQVFLQDPG
ncbi:hypothetical protein BOTBODRAFT_176297 [Botryobasidium botryosum FD-172 SS1]|uniref:Uncharacterized protein n=1 Tax=Botryobasidium botryosum (strain FD-172 SS1) TaxID=930990 RepID=A0A067ML51_BOTB1|nr:hypothetical protein BOTBODRAFT_176297 [Botryobasidium botryosum FD-172 SS1]